VSGKPLTIAFEEISARKATYHRLEPGEEDGTDVLAEAAEAEGAIAAVDTVAGILADVDTAADEVADLVVAEVPTDDAVADLTPDAEATELPPDL
jgi:hypothetical protein